MWGTKALLWEIRRTIMGPVVCTCLHCRENYCRQFSLYPDCHHSQPPVLFAGIPHSAWCTPASLRKLRMKSSDLCPLERKEHMTWPGPSDAQEPSRRAVGIIQLAGIPQWQQHPVVFSIGRTLKVVHQFQWFISGFQQLVVIWCFCRKRWAHILLLQHLVSILNRPFLFGCDSSQWDSHWIMADFSAWFFMMSF